MKTKNKTRIFSEEELKSISELGDVLRGIHKRLIKEGYIIKDGKITKPKDDIL